MYASKHSIAVTLVILIEFITIITTAYQNLRITKSEDTNNVILGFLNIIQWVSITAFPVIVVSHDIMMMM